MLMFSLINIFGIVLFISSIYIGMKATNPKTSWFINGFLLAGLILIVYSSTFEIEGAMHSVLMPFFHLFEILLVIYSANKMRLQDDRQKYAELTKLPIYGQNAERETKM